MLARTHSAQTHLWIDFRRNDDLVDRVLCQDGDQAAKTIAVMAAKFSPLEHGDMFFITSAAATTLAILPDDDGEPSP